MSRQPSAIKGRGAAGNPHVRFDRMERLRDDEFEVTDAPVTTVISQKAASIIARNDSPDIPFNLSVNPYQGCEHGCVYCYARPSHAYLGLSPGLDFETKIFAKDNAAELLRSELAKPGYKCEMISLGANTDPYQPVERERRITRSILEVLHECRHPVGIVTKSSLVERDLDILTSMAKDRLVQVFISLGTLDSEVARKLEPRATAPWRRIEAIRTLASSGVVCGVFIAPVIPFINDKDIEQVLEAASKAGASTAGYVVLRLPYELKEIFKDWLELHHPLKAEHVMARVRDLRGGKENDSTFGQRMRGQGAFADLIAKRFEIACRRHGLNAGHRYQVDTSRFRPPKGPQMQLF